MELDIQAVRENVRPAATDDLLHRPTVYRVGMEPAALTLIPAELESPRQDPAHPPPHAAARDGVPAERRGSAAVAAQAGGHLGGEGVRLRGTGRLGAGVTPGELRASCGVVVAATGLGADAPLANPGAALSRVRGAGEGARFVDGYPDAPEPEPLGERRTARLSLASNSAWKAATNSSARA